MYAGSMGAGKAHVMLEQVKKIKEAGNSLMMLSLADPLKKFAKYEFGISKTTTNSSDIDLSKLVAKFINYFNVSNDDAYFDIMEKNQHLDKQTIEAFENNTVIQNRFLLQIIGTDIAHTISKYFWVNNIISKIQTIQNEVDYVIIDDIRFMFEYLEISRIFPNNDIYYIRADKKTRAKRRNISVEELDKQMKHISESESQTVIYPYMKLHFPDNIIMNN